MWVCICLCFQYWLFAYVGLLSMGLKICALGLPFPDHTGVLWRCIPSRYNLGDVRGKEKLLSVAIGSGAIKNSCSLKEKY